MAHECLASCRDSSMGREEAIDGMARSSNTWTMRSGPRGIPLLGFWYGCTGHISFNAQPHPALTSYFSSRIAWSLSHTESPIE